MNTQTTTQSRTQTAGQLPTGSIAKKQIMQVRIEGILKAHGLLDRFQEGRIDYVKLTRPNYMPLVIEHVITTGPDGANAGVSVAHFFLQNGDVMYDPEIVFLCGTWEAVEITQHPVAVYRAKYIRRNNRILRANRFYPEVQPLVRMWASNLKEQGWADVTKTTVAAVQ